VINMIYLFSFINEVEVTAGCYQIDQERTFITYFEKKA